ncbi:MAG: HlyD family efflux transporter periplasmic adaptor subunit [Planctomycetota bacterium]
MDLAVLRAIAIVTPVLIGMSLSPGQCTAQTPTVVGDLVVEIVDQTEVPALEAGPVAAIEVHIGDQVQANQLLARLDSRVPEAQQKEAETELAVAQSRYDQFRADQIAEIETFEKRELVNQQQSLAQISKAKSTNEVRIAAAERAEAVAKNEWSRATLAREKFVDSVSQSELDSLRLKYEQAQLERIQATFERRLDRIKSDADQSVARGAELAADRAEVQRQVAAAQPVLLQLEVRAKAETLALRTLALDRHRVTAPTDGQVVEVYRRKGEWVRPGDPLFRVVNLERLRAEGFLKGNVIPKRGTEVTLFAGERRVAGKVVFISPERDSVSGEYRFLVEFKGGVFHPGEHVDIEW